MALTALNKNYTGEVRLAGDLEMGCPKHGAVRVALVKPEACPTCHGNNAMTEWCPVCDMDCGCEAWK